jgi:Zn-dependent protease with chaperone function
MAGAAGGKALPAALGPVDRTTFFHEQERRRRESRRLVAVCAVAVALLGAPLSMLATPLAFATIALTARVLALSVPALSAVVDALRNAVQFVTDTLDLLAEAESSAEVPWLSAIAMVALVTGPGVAAILLVWTRLRRAYVESGVAGILLAIGAREPRTDDLEERQLVNIVEEMAIAGGMAPPRVMLIDNPSRNVGILGGDPAHATVIASRGALDSLDRAETQAAIAHVIASTGNGDLKLALAVTAVFHAIGLTLTAFDAVAGFSGSAWRDLLLVARWLAAPRTTPAEQVRELLARSVDDVRSDGLSRWLEDSSSNREPQTRVGRALKRVPVLWALLFPFLLLYIVVLLVRMEVFLLRSIAVGPLVMLLWRTRRYLADATAIQLTRDPDALGRALVDIEGSETPVPAWARHLMIVHGTVPRGTGGRTGDWANEMGGFVNSHPPLQNRLRRIQAQGGTTTAPPTRRLRAVFPSGAATPRQKVLAYAGTALIAVLVPIMVVMLATAVTLAFVMAAAGSMIACAAALLFIVSVLL